MSGEGQGKISGGSLFDIVGPVMVGPSSSHTAGAVRLANLARLVAEEPIVEVEFVLYNSFAQTYQGHGTDRGLLAGLLGYGVNDDRIRDAFELATAQDLRYRFTPFQGANHYSPNTVVFNLKLAGGRPLTITGHSIGGGKVYLSKIDDYNVSIKGELPTLVMFYKDQPGMIWRVTKVLAERNVNIATLTCNRRQRREQAFMIVTMDELPDGDAVEEIRAIPDTYRVICIDKLPS